MSFAVLGIMDRPFRGAIEVQFFDVLYGVLDLSAQFSRADVALRGLAVTLAVRDGGYELALKIGASTLTTLPDYRAAVSSLVAEGIQVFVDEPDLKRLGFGAGDLVPGVQCLDTNDLAARWGDYEAVWFV